jgi:hypothetical protein
MPNRSSSTSKRWSGIPRQKRDHRRCGRVVFFRTNPFRLRRGEHFAAQVTERPVQTQTLWLPAALVLPCTPRYTVPYILPFSQPEHTSPESGGMGNWHLLRASICRGAIASVILGRISLLSGQLYQLLQHRVGLFRASGLYQHPRASACSALCSLSWSDSR